ncbi:CsiV family protein [Spiribacter halobius]|uniref:Uncharacterized protein n=1 Tax=Sediminicurvatus halobius TaxID=2182432 RepID=A0A2U2N1W2_9GAMM|nr:CsiV family protein [Spiribacter halobius]PWG63215.1 hypothetical protein DEM34_09055 [Spiribacter halobius]UEX76715.1 peptidoglycan binding protein CsiV [Spiribacter halobius]
MNATRPADRRAPGPSATPACPPDPRPQPQIGGLSGLALAALLLAAMPSLAFAQDAAADPEATAEAGAEGEEALDWYRVEVIVFRQPPLPEQALEAPPLVTSPPDGRPLQSLRSGADGETPFARLAPGALQLGDVARRLERQPGFQVLVHAGWEQPGLGQAEAPYVPLPFQLRIPSPTEGSAGSGEDAPGPFALLPQDTPLYGTLRLYRERYLHFETDLRYRLPGEPPASVRLDEALAPDPDYDPALQVMTVSRRMRSEELHYLDHPVLGVIVRAIPLEDE